MESQTQNSEFRNNPENFHHPCISQLWKEQADQISIHSCTTHCVVMQDPLISIENTDNLYVLNFARVSIFLPILM